MGRAHASLIVLIACLPTAASPSRAAGDEAARQPPPILRQLADEAGRMKGWVETELAREFLSAVPRLPRPDARTLGKSDSGEYLSWEDAASLPAEKRKQLEKVELKAGDYYTTRYGTPLAYARALDFAGRAGMKSFSGRKVLDFGYGTVGHLRLIALAGGEAVGVDVDPFLKALYSHEGDQGVVRNGDRPEGRVRLIDGHWPSDPEVREAVGKGYDLFISKNTLKRGYIHPEREADPKRLVHLKVDDETYLRHLHDILNPGGIAVIYNLSPAQNPPDKPYIPWADGRSPFPREMIERAGFEVSLYDQEETVAAREMARLLKWDETGMDIETQLFGHVTVFIKPTGK